jgi:hypothetical protein
MSFAFFTGPTVDITRSKRVYLADIPTMNSSACSGAGAGAPATCSVYL